MKTLFFAAALTLGTAAVAQSGATVDDPSQSTGPRGVTQQGTDPDGQPCSPAGYNQGAGSYAPCETTAGSATGPAGAASLPPCSRTVKDRCTQTYERPRRS